jgi:hypothetical protein
MWMTMAHIQNGFCGNSDVGLKRVASLAVVADDLLTQSADFDCSSL